MPKMRRGARLEPEIAGRFRASLRDANGVHRFPWAEAPAGRGKPGCQFDTGLVIAELK